MSPASLALIAGAVALGATWLVRTQRRRSRERALVISTMGFQPIEQPDAQLSESLLPLYRRGRIADRRLRLVHVFHRDSPIGHLYIFDVQDPRSSRQSVVATSAVGVVRRGARLPSFEILAYAEGGGPLGSMMVGFVGKSLGHGRVLRFDDLPEFGRRFTVLLPHEEGEAAVRGYLTPGLRQELSSCKFLILAAEGDAFALQPNPASTPGRLDESELLRSLVDEAQRLAAVLRPGTDSPRGSVPGPG